MFQALEKVHLEIEERGVGRGEGEIFFPFFSSLFVLFSTDVVTTSPPTPPSYFFSSILPLPPQVFKQPVGRVLASLPSPHHPEEIGGDIPLGREVRPVWTPVPFLTSYFFLNILAVRTKSLLPAVPSYSCAPFSPFFFLCVSPEPYRPEIITLL